jgi:hypothetical protein
MATIDALLQLLPQVEQDQETIRSLQADNRELRKTVEELQRRLQDAVADAGSAHEEKIGMRSLLRRKDDEIRLEKDLRRQAQANRDHERRLRLQAESQRDRETEKRHQAEERLLLKEEETTAIIQQAEEETMVRIREAEDRAQQDRRAREEGEEFTRELARKNHRLRVRLRSAEKERDRFGDDIITYRDTVQELREELNSNQSD